MRRAGGLVAALLILGLAAAGLISAQKNVTHSSSAGAVSDSLAASGPPAIVAASQRAPVNATSELPRSGADGVSTHFGATTRVAEATASPPTSPNAPAANASAPTKSSPIRACDKPGGMGLARIVEIDTSGGPGFGFEHFIPPATSTIIIGAFYSLGGLSILTMRKSGAALGIFFIACEVLGRR
jgi:hypothetical protein